MIENATVTLPLNEFDELRADSKVYRKIAQKIAACFEYQFKEYDMPEECKACRKDDCTKCKVYKEKPPFEEILTVDVEQLINAAKQCALYGKNIDSDVEEMRIVKKKRGKGE